MIEENIEEVEESEIPEQSMDCDVNSIAIDLVSNLSSFNLRFIDLKAGLDSLSVEDRNNFRCDIHEMDLPNVYMNYLHDRVLISVVFVMFFILNIISANYIIALLMVFCFYSSFKRVPNLYKIFSLLKKERKLRQNNRINQVNNNQILN